MEILISAGIGTLSGFIVNTLCKKIKGNKIEREQLKHYRGSKTRRWSED